ncbi:MAG: efflux RND transporter periplasmic adaptor subunit [Opitutales bacterium]|nr:efflux RND transporter periplasmic adaptor subunit [Opitutales bacterium]
MDNPDSNFESYETAPKRRWWLWAVLLLATAAGGWFFLNRESDTSGGVRFQTVDSETGDVVAFVRATGQLNPVRKVQVGSQISGNIAELHVDFNDPVEKGQLVALLDTATYDAALRLAEAELERAESVLELHRITESRTRELLDRGHTTESEMDRAAAETRQAEASVRIQRSRVDTARLDLERCRIISPTDGVVISRNVDVGQTVAASLSAPVLFEIADDLSRMKINTHVSEADIGVVVEGQRVEFRVDAYRNEVFEGSVHQVRNAPILVDNVVSYDTVVYFANPGERLKPGMTAEVNVITDELRDVIRLRNTALRARLPDGLLPERPEQPEADGDWRLVYLFRGHGQVPEPRWVRAGISDGIYTEILEGLEEGETLVVGLSLQATGADGGDRGSLFTGRQAQY